MKGELTVSCVFLLLLVIVCCCVDARPSVQVNKPVPVPPTASWTSMNGFDMWAITWGNTVKNRSEVQGSCNVSAVINNALTNWTCIFYANSTIGTPSQLVAPASTFTQGVRFNTYEYAVGRDLRGVPSSPWGVWFAQNGFNPSIVRQTLPISFTNSNKGQNWNCQSCDITLMTNNIYTTVEILVND